MLVLVQEWTGHVPLEFSNLSFFSHKFKTLVYSQWIAYGCGIVVYILNDKFHIYIRVITVVRISVCVRNKLHPEYLIPNSSNESMQGSLNKEE